VKLPDNLSIGAPFEGGFFGGVVRVDAALFAIVWAPKAEGETTGAWLASGADVPGARSCADSLTNTLALAEAGSDLAKWALALRINGFDDWCLPSRDVLELAYRHLKPSTYKTGGYFRDGDNPTSVPPGYPYASGDPVVQTPAIAFQKGNAEAFDEAWYWSSSQSSAGGAWGQDFNNGNQDSDDKSFEARARAVRRFPL
jgi:Protein of unknown function (DUF1566)